MGCDSLISLELIINHAQQLELQGLSLVYVATNLVDGIYEYCVTDSTGIAPGSLIWSCTVPEWIVRPSESGFRCKLWVTTPSQGTLLARLDEDCDVSFGLEIIAQWFGIEEERDTKISVFPNPTNGKLLIEGILPDKVQVYNALGQVVKTVRETNEIDLSGLMEGVYLLRITDADGKVYTNKITIR